jgi:hypothetical protein
MRMPEEIFEEVAMTLGVGEADTDDLYRRRVHRFPVEAEVTLTPAGVMDARSRTVTLTNISPLGVCIVDSVILGVGQQFIVSLPRLGGKTFSIMCTVKQSRLTAHGQYRAGAEFTAEHNDAALTYVGGLRGAGAGTSDEPMPRDGEPLNGGWPAQLAVVGDTEALASAATMVEHSRTGLGLILQRAISVGDRFVVRFTPPAGKPTKCMCVATHVRMLDHGKYRVTARIEGVAVQRRRRSLLGWMLKSFS